MKYCIALLSFLCSCNFRNDNIIIDSSVVGSDSSSKTVLLNDALKQVVGNWVSSKKIYSDLTQYDLLLFNEDGSLKFAQGSSFNQACRLARESKLIGGWKIVTDSFNNLILEDRFLIEINIEGFDTEILRVELDPIHSHRMGRTINETDEIRDAQGLYSFGGKIFNRTVN
jgi:hypothetical protein